MKSRPLRFVVFGVLVGLAVWLVRWTRMDEQFFSDPATERADTGYREISTGLKTNGDVVEDESPFDGVSPKAVREIIRVRPDQNSAWSRGTIRLRYTGMTYARPAVGNASGDAEVFRAYYDINQEPLDRDAIRQWRTGVESGSFEWNGRFPRVQFAFELSSTAGARASGFRATGLWLFDSRTHVRIAPVEFESSAGMNHLVVTSDLWKWHTGPVEVFMDLIEADKIGFEDGTKEVNAIRELPIRFWFHLPDVPGLPASNRGLNNLFEGTVPRLRLPSVEAHRQFLSRALQLRFQGEAAPAADPGLYPRDYESVSLRDLMIDYSKLYPHSPRIKILQRQGVATIGAD